MSRRTRTSPVLTSAVVGSIGVAALAGGLMAGRTRRRPGPPEQRHGITDNGMEYLVLGDGPKQLLFIPGGPGSETSGFEAGMITRHLAPFVAAGYTAWAPTRRRGMPPGYSLSEMADDYAGFIRDHLGGRADLVIGTSYGGVILPYLAADHPALVRRAVLCYAAATVTDQGREVDLRWARARAEGRFSVAGAAMLEYFLPAGRWAPVRRLLGPLPGRLFASSDVPAGDLLVEAEAEYAYDGRDVVARIQCPVLLLGGASDMSAPPPLIDETAELIPDCTVITYPGGHMHAMSPRIPPDVLAWVEELDRVEAGDGPTA